MLSDRTVWREFGDYFIPVIRPSQPSKLHLGKLRACGMLVGNSLASGVGTRQILPYLVKVCISGLQSVTSEGMRNIVERLDPLLLERLVSWPTGYSVVTHENTRRKIAQLLAPLTLEVCTCSEFFSADWLIVTAFCHGQTQLESFDARTDDEHDSWTSAVFMASLLDKAGPFEMAPEWEAFSDGLNIKTGKSTLAEVRTQALILFTSIA
jgi:hypothetical protein